MRAVMLVAGMKKGTLSFLAEQMRRSRYAVFESSLAKSKRRSGNTRTLLTVR